MGRRGARWRGSAGLALVLGALLLAACAPAAPGGSGAPAEPLRTTAAAKPAAAPAGTASNAGAGPAGTSAEWEQLVAAAKREGAVVVAAPPGQEYRQALTEPFERAFPGIKVEVNAARSPEHWARIQAERTAGRYLTDVFVSGGATTVLSMKPAGAVAPLRPVLVLPEVVDESAWLDRRLWWNDAAEPYTTLIYQGNVQTIVAYNKNLVNPAELTSYWDLLNPKWKGRIEATDVRPGIVGGVSSRWIYLTPSLGPEFLERLHAEMDITLGTDQRQLIDRLAQGQFALFLFSSPAPLLEAIQLGLPIDFLPPDQLKEGAPIGAIQGGVALLDRAPHPAAAQVFVNWLLSREGQLAWQAQLKGPSLRTDIPKDGLYAPFVPKPGVAYVSADSEEYSRLGPAVLSDLITRALERSGR